MGRNINFFIFNGRDSRDFGLWVTAGGLGTFDGAAADTTSNAVAGRDGDVLVSNNRRGNKPLPYQVFLNLPPGLTLAQATDDIRNWLQEDDQYHRLEDSYHPGFYREAAYLETFSFSDTALKGGTATITFSCKPNLRFEDIPVTGTGTVKLINPTRLRAKPLIRLGAVSGVVSLLFQSDADGSKTYTFGEEGKSYQDVVIDCESMRIYEDGIIPNNLFLVCKFPLEFPSLPLGVCTLTVSGNPEISVIPRWISR